jgi:hypothetical protein
VSALYHPNVPWRWSVGLCYLPELVAFLAVQRQLVELHGARGKRQSAVHAMHTYRWWKRTCANSATHESKKSRRRTLMKHCQ